MQTLEYRFVDKATWGEGPWQDEPDKKQWTDAATGLPCLIVRGPSGALCGYVGVAEDHPWHGVGYHAQGAATCGDTCDEHWHHACTPEGIIDAHGGLTFSDFCADGEPAHGICHRPDPGEPDRVWWFGFDCAHAGDYSPGSEARYRKIVSPEVYAESERVLGLGKPTGWGTFIEYRDVAYVTSECASLARQLVAVTSLAKTGA